MAGEWSYHEKREIHCPLSQDAAGSVGLQSVGRGGGGAGEWSYHEKREIHCRRMAAGSVGRGESRRFARSPNARIAWFWPGRSTGLYPERSLKKDAKR
eukprot:SAG31_NODE_217_length_19988_cov_53.300820_14_plen_98_part_00